MNVYDVGFKQTGDCAMLNKSSRLGSSVGVRKIQRVAVFGQCPVNSQR